MDKKIKTIKLNGLYSVIAFECYGLINEFLGECLCRTETDTMCSTQQRHKENTETECVFVCDELI